MPVLRPPPFLLRPPVSPPPLLLLPCSLAQTHRRSLILCESSPMHEADPMSAIPIYVASCSLRSCRCLTRSCSHPPSSKSGSDRLSGPTDEREVLMQSEGGRIVWAGDPCGFWGGGGAVWRRGLGRALGVSGADAAGGAAAPARPRVGGPPPPSPIQLLPPRSSLRSAIAVASEPRGSPR